MFHRLLSTHATAATLLIRIMVGGVFLAEGLQKFLDPADLGSGRFAKIGIPAPEFFGPFVGGFEVVCGALILLGLITRFAAVPLLVIIAVALFSTKVPILLGHDFMGFPLRPLDRYGLLSMIHEARTDLAMTLGALFLLIVGAGSWSLDFRLARSGKPQRPST